ncbi:MAG TPA: Hsp20/alpha crystallin family protein [Mycobacteriales bacterium]|nr:Hsp20/alpha crystallin family protein [Mycobacteriales bacterium]
MTSIANRTDKPASARDSIIDLTDPGRLLARLLGEAWPSHGNAGDHFIPGAEVTETDEMFTVDIELPGVAKKDIGIDVTGRRVSVHGERVEKTRDGTLRHTTRSTGRFDYEVTLPSAVEGEKSTAVLADGVLSIKMPKARSERPTHVSIT